MANDIDTFVYTALVQFFVVEGPIHRDAETDIVHDFLLGMSRMKKIG